MSDQDPDPVAALVEQWRAEAANLDRGLGPTSRSGLLRRVAHELEAALRSRPPADGGLREALVCAFVQGAQWCEWDKEGATMWPSDRDRAEEAARARLGDGTLGLSHEARIRAALARPGADQP